MALYEVNSGPHSSVRVLDKAKLLLLLSFVSFCRRRLAISRPAATRTCCKMPRSAPVEIATTTRACGFKCEQSRSRFGCRSRRLLQQRLPIEIGRNKLNLGDLRPELKSRDSNFFIHLFFSPSCLSRCRWLCLVITQAPPVTVCLARQQPKPLGSVVAIGLDALARSARCFTSCLTRTAHHLTASPKQTQ